MNFCQNWYFRIWSDTVLEKFERCHYTCCEKKPAVKFLSWLTGQPFITSTRFFMRVKNDQQMLKLAWVVNRTQTNKNKNETRKRKAGDYFCVNIPFKFLFSLAVVVIQAGPKPGMSHLFFLCRTVLIYLGSSTLMHAWSLNNPDTQTEMKDSLLSSCSCQIFGWQRSRKVPSSHQGGHHLLHVCVHACMCVRAWLHVCVCIWISSNVCGWVGACILACVCGVSFCLGNGFCSYSTCP